MVVHDIWSPWFTRVAAVAAVLFVAVTVITKHRVAPVVGSLGIAMWIAALTLFTRARARATGWACDGTKLWTRDQRGWSAPAELNRVEVVLLLLTQRSGRYLYFIQPDAGRRLPRGGHVGFGGLGRVRTADLRARSMRYLTMPGHLRGRCVPFFPIIRDGMTHPGLVMNPGAESLFRQAMNSRSTDATGRTRDARGARSP